MSENTRSKRRYNSARRQAQAAETRQQIVTAAGKLFIELGYAGTTIEDIARAAGIEQVAAVDSPVAFGEAAIEAFARNDLSVIVAKVAAVGPNHYGMDLQLPENAFRFRRWIASRKAAEVR